MAATNLAGCGTFVEVFDNVRDGTCVAGVLPIEDSIGGQSGPNPSRLALCGGAHSFRMRQVNPGS